LNRLISADHGGERLMTMHLSIIDARSRAIRWVSAGHDPAIIYDPANGSFDEIGEGDLPLGVMDETEYREQSHGPLRPGQVILVGTDGVWEMPNATGEPFGKNRLRDAIRAAASGSAQNIADAIREKLATFRGDAKQVDELGVDEVGLRPERRERQIRRRMRLANVPGRGQAAFAADQVGDDGRPVPASVDGNLDAEVERQALLAGHTAPLSRTPAQYVQAPSQKCR